MIQITSTAHGPIFEGDRVPAVIDTYYVDLKREVGIQVMADVHYVLDRRIQHPTPYYETQIVMQQVGNRDWSVNDRGVIYGPWLEGTSHRNTVSRFKGYHAFRLAFQEAQQYVGAFAQRLWAHYSGQVG